jgi:hypothetical protein
VAEGRFAGGFAISGAQNVVKCVVNRGGVVVKAWLEDTIKTRHKKYANFCIFFCFFATIPVGTPP